MNQRELDVLSILLNSGEAMTGTDIVNQKRDITQSTVTAVLRKLLHEGYIEVNGVVHSGKVLSRTYVPTESARSAVLQYLRKLYQPFSDVISIEEVVEELSKPN